MTRVKMGYFNLSIPEQIERSRLIKTKIAGNLNFPLPVPSLADFGLAIDQLEIMYNESRTGDRVKMKSMRLRQKELMALVRRLAAYVQNESGGDAEKILSSGFDVVIKGVPLGPVAQVHNLRLRNGSSRGSFRALWNKVRGSFCYIVQISDEGTSPDNFRLYRVVGNTRLDLTGLEPGRTYWVRICAIGSAGYGLWSEIGSKVAEL